MNKQFKLQPQLLAACAPAMSKELTRYYLMGVHIFERDGKLIYEATQGDFLIRIKSMLEQPEEAMGLNVIIPDFLVKELSKKSFIKSFNEVFPDVVGVDASFDGIRIQVEMQDGLINSKVIDGKYPDSDRVIPDNENKTYDGSYIGLDMKYMAAIAKSLKIANGNTQAKFYHGKGDCDPVHIKADDANLVAWEAVLMPCRL